MSWFNSNFVHNILNVAITGIGVVETVAVATGCTTNTAGTLECTHSFIPPIYALPAVAVLGGIKLVMNAVRDGLAGMAKPQPPVVDKITAVKVEAVAAKK